MTITALEIQEIRFAEAKRGYDPNEVDEFLERVAADVDTLNRALTEAAARIKTAEVRVEEAEQKAAQAARIAKSAQEKASQASQAKPEPVVEIPKEKSTSDISEEDISKAFIAAQKSAEAIKDDARKEADKVYREAESKGRDIVREALAEKQKTLGELDRLRESCEEFRTEYLSLLKHFQSDAQKRLTDFDELIPKKPEIEQKSVSESSDGAASSGFNQAAAPARAQSNIQAQASILKENDAAVGVVSQTPDTTYNPSPRNMAPVIPTAPVMFEDDDLDIEEID